MEKLLLSLKCSSFCKGLTILLAYYYFTDNYLILIYEFINRRLNFLGIKIKAVCENNKILKRFRNITLSIHIRRINVLIIINKKKKENLFL